MPLTGLISPFNDNSPTNALLETSLFTNCSESNKTDNAIGKSKYVPSFKSSAGAKLMVTFLSGNENPELVMALRTRSLASLIVLLAMPTILKAGSPRFISPSTSTNFPSKPYGTIE